MNAPQPEPEPESDRERWDRKYSARGLAPRPAASFLERAAQHLPDPAGARRLRAVDLAGGDGRNALWLADRGWEVTLCDVSPVGLAHARELAAARDLGLETLARDLVAEGPPPGSWDLALCFHYLQRDLFPRLPELLAPGGWFLFCQPTRRNLERHAHPSARFLLAEGELAELLPPELEVVALEEGWLEEGRHEARVIARRGT